VNLWSSLAAAFVAGFGSGAAFAFFRLKLKLSFYQHFIEDRLSQWTDQHVPVSKPAEPFWTGAFDAAMGPVPVPIRGQGISGSAMRKDLASSRSLVKQ
jgi:hypothetical protein